MKKIAIIGSRRRNTNKDYEKVEAAFLVIYEKGDKIVSGGCSRGGDRFAEAIADKFGIPIKVYYPNWKLGRHAGFLRNTDIARVADVLIACVAFDREGGTEDTIEKFRKFHPKNKMIFVEN